MSAVQMTFLPEVNEKEVKKEVIRELRKYRSLKVKFDNRKEQKEYGVVLFKSFKPIGSKDIEKIDELRVTQVERCLNISLDELERSIIEKKYLSPHNETDLDIYLDLGLKKDSYYKIKGSALMTIATSLGML
ncbi:ArpU family phage packaging/lysis transcriptional regulator [Alkalicoccobacillus plakortidis]|uniref:ArpU family transcriptional regulator n=1 Tax=Alkalicoccobacillus plakortidis TaxID=444060 RepID=A0ABT0XDV1_9BACI|nr:ArpU family phage packaging/lysis transcriptional regulator [Alkalicoccobacillus plakortidis]MCM2674071.1 ArpU family transcriptional regulator [Alkalicoccobacillus plakortidis]